MTTKVWPRAEVWLDPAEPPGKIGPRAVRVFAELTLGVTVPVGDGLREDVREPGNLEPEDALGAVDYCSEAERTTQAECDGKASELGEAVKRRVLVK